MPAHIKAALTPVSLAIPVAGGRLALGTAALCELGFERERRVIERWNLTQE